MNRFQRDHGVLSGAGGEEIVDLSQVPPAAAAPVELTDAERQIILREAYDGDNLKPGYVLDEASGLPYKEGELPPGATAPTAVEGMDAEGNLLEGYELVEGVPTKIEEQSGEDPKNFFDVVEAITGVPIQVDYGETDPATPEGMAIRERAVMDHGVSVFEDYIKNSVPDAYAYLLHRQAGGTKEEFFQSNANPSLPTIDIFEASSDLQASLIKSSLVNRGVPEDIAQATVDSFIKANTLKEKSMVIYKELDGAQQAQIANIKKIQEENDKRFNAEVKAVMTTVDETINTGSIKFIIPDAERTEFANFVKERIRYSEGNFYITQSIAKDNVNTLIESLFIQYSGNDLKKLIDKEARSVATEKFKFKVKTDAAAEKKTVPLEAEKRKNIPLSQI